MSLTKLEIVESDEQNPDPIDKIIKLEMLSSGVDVTCKIGSHSISSVSFDDEIDILVTVKIVKIKLPKIFARKVPRGNRFHPLKYIPRKWRLNPPNGARIIASHIILFDGLKMISTIPIIKSTTEAIAGNAK